MPAPPDSASISSLDEARAYYAAKLAGAHKISCHGQPVTIVFERQATHLFSTEADSGEEVPIGERVSRQLGGGRRENRRFNLERARLMDDVLPAVSKYTVSIPGTGATSAREKRMVHGPLTNARSLRVVLRPGPGDAWTCVSAYPVTQEVWLASRRSKRAKFPP